MPVEPERTLEGGHLTVPLQVCKTQESIISSPHTMLILANGPKKQLTSFRIFSHLQKEQIGVSCWVIIWLTSSLSDLIMSFVLSSGLCCGPNCNRIYYYV